MKNTNQKLGAEGEEVGVQFLHQLGYKIIARNVRMGHDEIDIVAKDRETLVFVEVKTRATNNYGVPEDFITRQKEACLIRAAEAYIYERDWEGDSRFDVIAVHYAGRRPVIRHIEDAFFPSW